MKRQINSKGLSLVENHSSDNLWAYINLKVIMWVATESNVLICIFCKTKYKILLNECNYLVKKMFQFESSVFFFMILISKFKLSLSIIIHILTLIR